MAQRRFRPINYPTSGGTAWGSITGTLSDQTDLQAALDLKANSGDLNTTNWDTAYGWGDHSVEGYVTGGPYLPTAGGTVTGDLALTNHDSSTVLLTLSGTSPTIYLKDTDATSDDFWIHVNSNNFYILSDTNDSGSWVAPYPLQLEADTETGYLFGDGIVTSALNGTSYYGLQHLGSDTGYTRTTTLGIIPHENGGGSSACGTAVWPFASAAFKYAIFTGGVDTPVQFQNVNVVGAPSGTIGNDILHVGYQVKGGAYDSTASNQTGYCHIRWPSGTTNDSTMMTMMIHGYNYSGTKGQSDGGAWCIQVGGYFYSTENWHNTSARIVSGSPPFTTVRFGEDETGDYKYVVLGDSTTNWNYPKVWLTDITSGHSTQYNDWLTGTFNIAFSASLPSNWSGDATGSPVYLGGQIRWDGEDSSNASGKNLGGRVRVTTASATGGEDGDIWFEY